MKMVIDEKTAIQAIKTCIKEVPFLKISKVSKASNSLSPDLRIEVDFNQRHITILAEYKNNGQPRIARQAVYQIKDWLFNRHGDYGVFIAPYISADAAAICKNAGIGYLDLEGNCLLSFDTIYIHREGKPKPSVQRREYRSLYSTKAERILRVLLSQPKKTWTTESLAEAAQVSYGQVSNVKKLLTNREWLTPNNIGIQLSKPDKLLDEWSEQYRFSRNKTMEFYALTEVVDTEDQLAKACRKKGIRYAFTAFSGASRIAPAVRYQRVNAYIDGNIEVLIKSLDWKLVPSGANVNLLVPYDEGVFYGMREITDAFIATPVQIYLDLLNYRGRGQEAADAIKKAIIQSW
jgi:Transcriptional regulator, AbiEi antitoxin, Type IV TA system